MVTREGLSNADCHATARGTSFDVYGTEDNLPSQARLRLGRPLHQAVRAWLPCRSRLGR